MRKQELYHYGVKGMKWGVRKLDKKNGDLYLRKGTTVKRVATQINDKTTYNRKYVSINQEDHSKWDNYLGKAYLNQGVLSTVHAYETVKDIKVMSSTKQGELYAKMLLNKKFKKQAVKDLKKYHEYMPQVSKTNDPSENISRIMSIGNLETGRKFVDEVLKRGYGAVEDTHGKNTSETPLIILNADTNLKKLNDVDYTDTVKEYLLETYGIAA